MLQERTQHALKRPISRKTGPSIVLFKLSVVLLGLLWFVSASTVHGDQTIRIGVLKFGTVNWELQVIKDHQLDAKHGFELEVVPLAGKNATHVSIQGGAVEMIVSDWIWVARQRQNLQDYAFAPYSTAAGSVMVRKDSNITSVADLQGARIGVAGGPIDKSWLLLSAYTRKTLGKPVEEMAEPSFAAPPLINELIGSGEFSAALNFWHYSARLKAKGMKELIRVEELLPTLGITREIPLIGWVFSESWAEANPGLVEGFLAASSEAQQLMKLDDVVWQQIRPMMKAETDAMAMTLRDAFREGIIECFNEDSVQAIEQAFSILAEIGGPKLAGSATSLAEGTVWTPAIQQECH